MLELAGDFAANGSAYQRVFGYFRGLGLLDSIISDATSTLRFTTSHGGRHGETRLYVGDVDVEETVPATWCTAGVQGRPTRIVIDIVDGCGDALAMELLTHEWCLHGTKDWSFVLRMRSAASPEEVANLSIAILGTASTAIEVAEHRELAEGTHKIFRQAMFGLRDAHPELADDLLAAWQADINDDSASARAGHVSKPSWDDPVPAVAPQMVTGTTRAQPDLEIGAEEQAALDSWLDANDTDSQ
jgi:hypothetical protein